MNPRAPRQHFGLQTLLHFVAGSLFATLLQSNLVLLLQANHHRRQFVLLIRRHPRKVVLEVRNLLPTVRFDRL